MTHVLTATPLALSPRIQERWQQGELTQQQINDFQGFLAEVDRAFLHHPITQHNPYTQWFSRGEATDRELQHFIQQFSVFSNQFLVAALLKVINSSTLQQSRASREILLNELGVIYRQPGTSPDRSPAQPDKAQDKVQDKAQTGDDKEREGDPELVSTAGTTMNLNGIKVSAIEIEQILNTVPEICETAAIAIAPPEGGPSRLIVYAVPQPQHPLSATTLHPILQTTLKQQINPLFKLHAVVVVESLPRTASHKIMRRVLRDRCIPDSQLVTPYPL